MKIKKGLYDTALDKDSCGIGFVASMREPPTHKIIQMGLEMLERLEHRGACGCDPLTGDGAGILLQIPHDFFKKYGPKTLPAAGQYAVGMVFLPADLSQAKVCVDLLQCAIYEEKQILLGWRDVPVEAQNCGVLSRQVMPIIRQIFIAQSDSIQNQDAFERKLYVIRKLAEHYVAKANLRNADEFYVCSLSSKTIVYKGQLTPTQLRAFYPDLTEPNLKSALAMIHSRFSTNTFPSWKRAHPYRYIIHNGEINTVEGNINWMRAREHRFKTDLFAEDFFKIASSIDEDGSDSAIFDNTFELLSHTGRSLPHVAMMMIPEAWQNNLQMSPAKKAFYEYHACLMEPWDGPTAIAFTDGKLIGAILDRNGLRPSRYLVTKSGLVVLSSEVGVLDIPVQDIIEKGRLQPGRLFLVDLAKSRIVSDDEIKAEIVNNKPYQHWLAGNLISIESLPAPTVKPKVLSGLLPQVQKSFGYTSEDLKILLTPMAINGQEPVGSMGIDTPLAVLTNINQPQNLFNYFKQLFAQVTNPPIDPLREEIVMSLATTIGAEQNLFAETPLHCQQIKLSSPTLSDEQLQQLQELKYGNLCSVTFSILFKVAHGAAGMRQALNELCDKCFQAAENDAQILILSDRGSDKTQAAIPILLAVAAVHHHLIRKGNRTKVGLVLESAEPREVMHFCLLAGYGAGAWNPYLAYETIRNMVRDGTIVGISEDKAIKNYQKAIDKGILKTATKMGISTLQAYRGAQIFEAIGLSSAVVNEYFTNTASRIEGIGLDIIAQEVLLRHTAAYHELVEFPELLSVGGHYQWRKFGESHMLNPDTVSKLQYAVRSNKIQSYKEYAALVNNPSSDCLTLRSLLHFKPGNPIPIEEVEPAQEIVKRFATGAMSLGSISREAHETLAIAMNRIGAKSNTGEGGEDPARYQHDINGDSRRSSIKQVASGRFGVTINYLVNADDLQIKIAQGAKPGEGGQLSGHKIDDYIAKIRYSVPGVELISPPPHHDIYSIEDIAELIYDLKNANPKARIHVKLVAEVGVGVIAAGVAKAKADVILISGYDGGTGASPLTSIHHAGIPWELGLAETQQALIANGLRGRVVLQTDGKMQTGRDVAIAALLGAEEFGFSTIPLVALGCIMMRACHLNTCPVGIATQDPVLRKKFAGKPEDLINYFFFVAEELREIMAQLGFKTIKDMVGRVDMLNTQYTGEHWKIKNLDLSSIIFQPQVQNPQWHALHNIEKQNHELDKSLDNQLIAKAQPALEQQQPVQISLPIKNNNRCVGTMLSGEVAKRYGEAGLPVDLIQCKFMGSAGQSFGAFLAAGITLTLEGDANDYVGKGLSGGKIIIYPPKDAVFAAEENILLGNVALYGATSGEAYFRGIAGERFAVRNSGAAAVVEGVGDHGCEYMTKGLVIVLGKTGRNFGAGMSGGVAYVLDDDGEFQSRCNLDMVTLSQVNQKNGALQLKHFIERHGQYTDSRVAHKILNGWDYYQSLFVKVCPVGYVETVKQEHFSIEGVP